MGRVVLSGSSPGPSLQGVEPAGREGPVKALGGTVKEPSGAALTSGNGAYEGRMTDVVYVLITLAAFVGLALLVGALDRPEKH
ncbi:MAG: hypothetical protein QOD98_3841 [Nocardioidaceae bacterium]|nr:hypothetical protein [Nocardioidaceae bacterium]